MEEKSRKVCDECGSQYYSATSRMDKLCPECSHQLYGYPPCEHFLEDGRCTKCYWDGSDSDYLKRLKRR